MVTAAGSAMFGKGAVVTAADGRAVDLDSVPAEELEAMISQQSAQISAAQARLAAMTAAAKRRSVLPREPASLGA